MNGKGRREQKRQRATEHKRIQKERKIAAVELATASLKSKKKGVKHLGTEMEKLEYLADGKGGWRPMHKGEREKIDNVLGKNKTITKS